MYDLGGMKKAIPILVLGLLLNINFNVFQFIISDQKVKNILTVQSTEAYNKGVFGAPSFIINNKLFWGQDRLEFVLKEAQR